MFNVDVVALEEIEWKIKQGRTIAENLGNLAGVA